MSNDERKNEIHAVESVGSAESPQVQKTSGQKSRAHLKRFWWLYAIVVALAALVIILCLIFVGMPNIAQSSMDKAQLTLESQSVTSPSPGSVHVKMNTTTKSNTSRDPQLYDFKAALFMEDTLPNIIPFGYITIPGVKVSDEFTTIVDQEMEVADQDQFARYNAIVLGSETYRVAIRGRVPLKQGGLPKTTVDFNHVIESKGLNNLKGLEIRNISISIIPSADGSNMKAQVYIPNPSPMTIEMGTISQDVFVGDTKIGTSTIPNLTLKPGDNLFNMTSVANQATVIGLITTKYPNAQLPVRIVGNNSTVNGQVIPYFTAALKASTLETTLDLGPALAAAGLNLSGGSTTGTSSSTSKPAASATGAAAR